MIARNNRVWLSLVFGLILLVGASITADAQHHRYHYRPYGYGHGYSHSYRYGYGPGYCQGATTGTLNFEVTPKNSTEVKVYINEALASEFKHKKSLRLTPGQYQIQVRKEGFQSQSRIVYVTEGESLKLDFVLLPAV